MIGALARWLFMRGAARGATAAAAEGAAATATTTATTSLGRTVATKAGQMLFGSKTRGVITIASADQLTGGHGLEAGKEFAVRKFNEAVEEKTMGFLQGFGLNPEEAKEKIESFNKTMKDLGLDGALGPAMKAGALGWFLGSVLPGDAWTWAVTFAAAAVAYHVIKQKFGNDFNAAANPAAAPGATLQNNADQSTREPGVSAPPLMLQEPEPSGVS